MDTAASLLHVVAGSPALSDCTPTAGPCWICGAQMARGCPVRKWQGANFTDQNKVGAPDATHVCEACVWAHSWAPPPDRPRAADATGKGLNLRLFSHLYDANGYRSANKADKRAIGAWLRREHRGPWFAAIADSGQKHVLPWTPVNYCGLTGGPLVRFEEALVRLTPTLFAALDSADAAVTAGVPKAQLLSGDYSPRVWAMARTVIADFEALNGSLRGSGAFTLAVWLAQGDEDAAAQRSNRFGDPGSASRVPRERGEPAQALGSVARSGEERGQDNDLGGGVDNASASVARDHQSKQGTLFADDPAGGRACAPSVRDESGRLVGARAAACRVARTEARD